MKVAVKLNANKVILNMLYLVSGDYSHIYNEDWVVVECETLKDIVNEKSVLVENTKTITFDNGVTQDVKYFTIDNSQDYCQEWKDNQAKELDFQAKQNELNTLLDWFKEYDLQVAQYNRAVRLNTPIDIHVGDKSYSTINELDTEAINKQMRIGTIRLLLNA